MRVQAMPYNAHEVCLCPLRAQNNGVFLLSLARLSVRIARVGPCRRILAPSGCVASTARLASPHALPLRCRPSGSRPLSPPLRALLAQRLSQIAAGYADGNEAKRLRPEPMVKRSVARLPLEPPQALARAPPLA